MKANPILEEVWRIKDQLATEVGYDVDRFFAQLRASSEAHPGLHRDTSSQQIVGAQDPQQFFRSFPRD